MSRPSARGTSGIVWRETCEADLEPCLSDQPHALGADIIGRRRALEIWKQLFHEGSLLSRVIEIAGPDGRRRRAGFGASVFVDHEFVTSEIRNPRLGLTSRIIAGLANGQAVVLSRRQVAEGNAGAGLDVVFLASVRWPTSNQLEFADMMMASVRSCVEAHAGYRLRSALVEISGDQLREVGNQSGELEVIKLFQDVDRALVRLTRDGAAAVAGSFSNLLFHYREPRLGLREADQHLLTRALGGATDRDLATGLGLTISTVKKRWRSIFTQVERLAPNLFAEIATGDEGKRGPQKRHLVLAYVRDHPEELRPFHAPSGRHG
ncbi:MAG TPA: hypothetical protein VEN29_10555 [Casimicrobiaceae bacterium]|nr:hypothetical protein [Casimicrobiaceae bacterium]